MGRLWLPVGLFSLSLPFASATDSGAQDHRFGQKYFSPYYENLVRDYKPGKAIVGPGSELDNAISDRRHKPLARGYKMPDLSKVLADADKNVDGDKLSLVYRLVDVVPVKGHESSVSADFIDAVKDGLMEYPRPFLCLMVRKKCKVMLSPLVSQVQPRLANLQPTGYFSGANYDNVGALFDQESNQIIIAQYRYHGEKRLPLNDFKRAAQHEAGHALDYYLEQPSVSSEFLECYELDRKELSPSYKITRAYFMQEGRRGPCEVFAELMASYCGDPQDRRWHHMPKLFPRCYGLLQKTFPNQ